MYGGRAAVHRARMHTRHVVAVALSCVAIAAAVDAAAEPVHKCVGAATTYQSQPCEAGERDVIVQGLATSATARPDGAGAPVDRARAVPVRTDGRWQPFRRGSLALGMTDDEALNAPDGGVPTRIARHRDRHSFRETWTYALPDGRVRKLSFVDGRLASADVVDAPALRVAAFGG